MGLHSRSMTFKVIFAVVAFLVIYKLIFWFGEKPTTVPRTLVENGETLGEDSPPANENVEAKVDEPESDSPAKRIVHVPDTRMETSLDSAPRRQPPEAYAEPVAANAAEELEKLLAGDMLAGVRLDRAINVCKNVPDTDKGLELAKRRLANLLRHREKTGFPVKPPLEEMPSLPGFVVYPSEEQNNTRLNALYAECAKMRKVFSGDLRKQLDQLAQQGDVAARLLFAIWPPVLAFEVDAFEQDLVWVNKAYAYSVDNLMDGEPAGLLAFGKSYESGLFTRQNAPLGESIIRAGLRCIVDEEDLQDVLDQELKRGLRITREGTRMDEDPDIVAFENRLSELCQ